MTEKEKMIEYWASYYGEANAKHITEVQLADRKAILEKVCEPLREARYRLETELLSPVGRENVMKEGIAESLNLADEMTKGTE